MKKKLLAILFGVVLVLGACGGGDGNNNNENDGVNNNANNDANNNESVNVGLAEEVYQNKCAGCHGDDLSGIAAPGLQEIGSKLSAEEIADIIENGQGGMPKINMADDERQALSEWLADKK